MLVQSRRDSRAALRLMRKLLRKQGFVAKLLVTDKLRSYGSAFQKLKRPVLMSRGSRVERKIQRFKSAHLLSASSACMPPSITPSTFNAISSRDRRCGSSELKRRANGGMRWPQCDRTSCFGFSDRDKLT